MKKFLLVLFIGTVLAIYLYGLFNDIRSFYEDVNSEEINKNYITVYEE